MSSVYLFGFCIFIKFYAVNTFQCLASTFTSMFFCTERASGRRFTSFAAMITTAVFTPPWMLLTLLLVCSSVFCQTPIDRVKSCGRRDRCMGRESELLVPPQEMTPKQVRSSQCFCDDKCAEYGDCCLDIASYPNTKVKNDWGCLPLSHNQSIYAIIGCKSENKKLKRLCDKDLGEPDYHYSLDVPVYSPSTKHFYANIYCAMCEDKTSSIEPVLLKIQCTDEKTTAEELLKKGRYMKGNLLWEIENEVCYLTAESNNTRGRPCVDSVTTCSIKTNTLAEKCTAYSQIVLVGQQRFKNPHCAFCNGFNLSNLTCWQGFDYRSLPSLSMLFDFNWDFETCDLPKSVWDGLERRCTNICTSSNKCHSCNKTSCQEDVTDLTLIVEGYLTIVCLSTSIFCLFLHIFLSFFLPNSNTLPAKILNSLSISLVIAQMLFLCGIDPLIDVPEDICQSVAILIHFFFLSSFFWMNVMSIDIWRTFSNASLKSRESRSHKKYSAYAWCSTGIVTIASLVSDLTELIPVEYRPHYAGVQNICWFANRLGLAIFFYLPICLLLLVNSIMFSITICWFQRQHKKSEFMKSSGRKEYTRLWLYIKLFVIMGLTWAFGMISALAEKPNYRYPFIVLNGLQGTFLFIMFDLKTDAIIYILRKTGMKSYNSSDSEQKKSDGTHSSRISSSSGNKVTNK